jgi:hypothetical protein
MFGPHFLDNYRNIKRGGVTIALVFAAFILRGAVVAQTTYHDPKGRFEFQVPDGWSAAPDEGVDQLIVRKGAVQAIIMVLQQNTSYAMTAKEAVDETTKEFQTQCPTTRVRKTGTVMLASEQGIYALMTCSDPKSPAVAETSAVLTDNTILIAFTMISPLAVYYANLPTLDGIRDSLRVAGAKSTAAVSGSADSKAMTELDRACTVGAFAQEDCARRMGIVLGQEAKQEKSAQEPAKGPVYQDPTGRFSLQVPEGWSAKAEGDNGVLGVQLRSESSWINVMPADPAKSASEVVLNQEQKVAAQSNSNRKVPFGILGLVQIFGNGLEVTYDDFNASTAQGNPIENFIGGVGNISGTDHNFHLLVASINAQKKEEAGAVFLSVAQSIRLLAH